MTPDSGFVVREQEPLARHCAARTGGTCDAFVIAQTPDGVAAAWRWSRDASLRLHVLGAGTRTLFRDAGVPGAVLTLGQGFCQLRADGPALRVGAATPAAAIATAVPDDHPLRSLRRIAGSLGGAIASADEPPGGWGRWIAGATWLGRGRVKTGTWEEMVAALPKAIVLDVELRLDAERPRAVRVRARSGAWYVEPPKRDLRALFRRVALHGSRVRGAAIPQHAPEMIVNVGEATAKDLALLEKSARERIKRHTGIELESTMRWVGRSG